MTYGFKDGKNKQSVYDTSEFSAQVLSVVSPLLAEKQDQHSALTLTLPVSGWSEIINGVVTDTDTQTIAVTGVTANNTIIVAAAPASASEYGLCGIVCIAQGSNSLTFQYQFKPSNDLTVNVVILEV